MASRLLDYTTIMQKQIDQQPYNHWLTSLQHCLRSDIDNSSGRCPALAFTVNKKLSMLSTAKTSDIYVSVVDNVYVSESLILTNSMWDNTITWDDALAKELVVKTHNSQDIFRKHLNNCILA